MNYSIIAFTSDLKEGRYYQRGADDSVDLRGRYRSPIMVLTVCHEDVEGDCRRAGADLFVSKPLPVPELEKVLKKLGLKL